jgi:TolB-like protein
MKKKFVVILFVLALASPSLAKTTIAVMDLNVTSGLSKPEAEQLSKKLLNELVATYTYDVIDRNKRDEVLKEQGFMQTGACDQTTCLIEAGELLGVQNIIGGSIGLIGNIYSVELQMVDVKSGRVEMPFSHEYINDVASLITAMKDAALSFSKWKPKPKVMDIPEQKVEYGKIKIYSKPSGAKIIVDGELVGYTPSQLNNIEIGEHSFIISKTGYNDYATNMQVTKTSNIINAKLKDVASSLKPIIYMNALDVIGVNCANDNNSPILSSVHLNMPFINRRMFNDEPYVIDSLWIWEQSGVKDYGISTKGKFNYYPFDQLLNIFYYGIYAANGDKRPFRTTIYNYPLLMNEEEININVNKLIGMDIIMVNDGMRRFDKAAVDSLFSRLYIKPYYLILPGVESQKVYDIVLKKYFRELSIIIDRILNNVNFNLFCKEYEIKARNTKVTFFSARGYAREKCKYLNISTDYSDILGILFRRKMDGTLPTFLKIWRTILKDYDPSIYNKIVNKL